MLLLPLLLERVFHFAIQHYDLLDMTLADLTLLHALLHSNIHWTPSYRFPYLTYHYGFLHWHVYIASGFAALRVGPMIVGASTLGRCVYLYGPQRDPVVEHVTYRVLAAEPL